MPLYEYECSVCGPFSLLRQFSQSSDPASCPDCGTAAQKVFSVINLGTMRPQNRKAWERNERSANQPHTCGSGCSHAKPGREVKSEKRVLEYSKKPNSRPWMLGH
jgi:putative FmdB family regulatory protein